MTYRDRARLADKFGLVLVREIGKPPEYRHDDQAKPKVGRFAKVWYPTEPERLTPKGCI